MDNISEAQADIASIPPPSSHQPANSGSTSISQELIFETDNKNAKHNNDDELNVIIIILCTPFFSKVNF